MSEQLQSNDYSPNENKSGIDKTGRVVSDNASEGSEGCLYLDGVGEFSHTVSTNTVMSLLTKNNDIICALSALLPESNPNGPVCGDLTENVLGLLEKFQRNLAFLCLLAQQTPNNGEILLESKPVSTGLHQDLQKKKVIYSHDVQESFFPPEHTTSVFSNVGLQNNTYTVPLQDLNSFRLSDNQYVCKDNLKTDNTLNVNYIVEQRNNLPCYTQKSVNKTLSSVQRHQTMRLGSVFENKFPEPIRKSSVSFAHNSALMRCMADISTDHAPTYTSSEVKVSGSNNVYGGDSYLESNNKIINKAKQDFVMDSRNISVIYRKNASLPNFSNFLMEKNEYCNGPPSIPVSQVSAYGQSLTKNALPVPFSDSFTFNNRSTKNVNVVQNNLSSHPKSIKITNIPQQQQYFQNQQQQQFHNQQQQQFHNQQQQQFHNQQQQQFQNQQQPFQNQQQPFQNQQQPFQNQQQPFQNQQQTFQNYQQSNQNLYRMQPFQTQPGYEDVQQHSNKFENQKILPTQPANQVKHSNLSMAEWYGNVFSSGSELTNDFLNTQSVRNINDMNQYDNTLFFSTNQKNSTQIYNQPNFKSDIDQSNSNYQKNECSSIPNYYSCLASQSYSQKMSEVLKSENSLIEKDCIPKTSEAALIFEDTGTGSVLMSSKFHGVVPKQSAQGLENLIDSKLHQTPVDNEHQ